MVWYSHLFKNFPVCCDPHKGFSIVDEAEADDFLEFSCFFHHSMDVGSLVTLLLINLACISGSSRFTNC